MPTGREAGDEVSGAQDSLEGRTSTEVREEAKSVEFTYRGIFQKTLAANLCKHVVMAARKRDWLGSTIQRYSDSPERNGIPAKQFAVIAPDTETLEQHMAKYEPNELDVITVLDDTMSDGIESWAWYGRQPINVRLRRGGTLLVISNRPAEELLKVIPQKPWDWTLAHPTRHAELRRLVGLPRRRHGHAGARRHRERAPRHLRVRRDRGRGRGRPEPRREVPDGAQERSRRGRGPRGQGWRGQRGRLRAGQAAGVARDARARSSSRPSSPASATRTTSLPRTGP